MKNKIRLRDHILFVCLLAIFLPFQSCVVHKSSIVLERKFCLNTDYPVFMDPFVTYEDTPKGLGLLLLSDSLLELYHFRYGQRYEYDFGGDVIVDEIKWKINGDTLTIGNYFQYKILKCRNDSLELLDIKGTAIRSKVLFIKSGASIKEEFLLRQSY